MKDKTMLIPASAIAVEMASTEPVDATLLRRAGLTKRQVAAFQIAREYKRRGDRERARNALARAGINLDALEEMRRASAAFG